jgi:TPR repeat protein
MDDEIVPSNELKSMVIYSKNNDYIQGLIVSGNSKQTNDLHAIFCLAKCCLHGKYIQKHSIYALILYKYAANLGHCNSQKALGDIYCDGLDGMTYDDNEAYKWYTMAAKQGNNNSKKAIAHMFMTYHTKKCSLDQAITYLLDVANTSDTDAQHSLGFIYQYMCRNDYEAVQWYTISAIHGNCDAQYYLGLLYKTSKTKLRNYTESLKWLKIAFANKDPSNFINMQYITIYEFGLGVDIDLIEAIKYYKLSSNHDRIKNIIIKNIDKICTIICDVDDKIKEQKKILDIQDHYITELEYMPQGPKYKAPKDIKTIKN